MAKDYGDKDITDEFIEEDHYLVKVYIPKECRWSNIKTIRSDLGEFLTDVTQSLSRENPQLEGVVNIVYFNATTSGRRIISDESLRKLVDVLSKYRLVLEDVEPDIIGRAYEYLLRNSAEGSGQSAGEFYTLNEVGILMSYILDPEPGETIYDPLVGSVELLIKCKLRLFSYGKLKKNGLKQIKNFRMY